MKKRSAVKRALSLFLTAAMVLSMVPAVAMAANAIPDTSFDISTPAPADYVDLQLMAATTLHKADGTEVPVTGGDISLLQALNSYKGANVGNANRAGYNFGTILSEMELDENDGTTVLKTDKNTALLPRYVNAANALFEDATNLGTEVLTVKPGDTFYLAMNVDAHLTTMKGFSICGLAYLMDTSVFSVKLSTTGVPNHLLTGKGWSNPMTVTAATVYPDYIGNFSIDSPTDSLTTAGNGTNGTAFSLVLKNGSDYYGSPHTTWDFLVPVVVDANATPGTYFITPCDSTTASKVTVGWSNVENGQAGIGSTGDAAQKSAGTLRANSIQVKVEGPEMTVTPTTIGTASGASFEVNLSNAKFEATGVNLNTNWTVVDNATGLANTDLTIELKSDTKALVTVGKQLTVGSFTIQPATSIIQSGLTLAAKTVTVAATPTAAVTYSTSKLTGLATGQWVKIDDADARAVTPDEVTNGIVLDIPTIVGTPTAADGKYTKANAIVVYAGQDSAIQQKLSLSYAVAPTITIDYSAETVAFSGNVKYSVEATESTTPGLGTSGTTTPVSITASIPAAAAATKYICAQVAAVDGVNGVGASKIVYKALTARPAAPAIDVAAPTTIDVDTYNKTTISGLTQGVVYNYSLDNGSTWVQVSSANATITADANGKATIVAARSVNAPASETEILVKVAPVTTSGSEAFASANSNAKPKMGYKAFISSAVADITTPNANTLALTLTGDDTFAAYSSANFTFREKAEGGNYGDTVCNVTSSNGVLSNSNKTITLTISGADLDPTKFYEVTVTAAGMTSTIAIPVLADVRAAQSAIIKDAVVSGIVNNNSTVAAPNTNAKIITFTSLGDIATGDTVKVYNANNDLLGSFVSDGTMTYTLNQTGVTATVWQAEQVGKLNLTRTESGKGESDKFETASVTIPAEKVVVTGITTEVADVTTIPAGTTLAVLKTYLVANRETIVPTVSYGAPGTIDVDWSNIYTDAACTTLATDADFAAIKAATDFYAKLTAGAYDIATGVKATVKLTVVEPTFDSAKGEIINITAQAGSYPNEAAIITAINNSTAVVVYGLDINGAATKTIKKELKLSDLTTAGGAPANIPALATDFTPTLVASTPGTYAAFNGAAVDLTALTNTVFGQSLTGKPGLSNITISVILSPAPVSGGGVSSYSVRFDAGQHGKITDGATTTRYKRGETVSAAPTVEAAEGYKFIGWSLNGKDIVEPVGYTVKNTLIFTAQYEEIKVQKPIEIKDVPDVPTYVSGTGDGTFKPNDGITRSAFVKMLVVAMGKYDATKTYTGSFVDVAPDAWDAQYIACATELGLVSGTGDGAFSPNRPITRAEAAKIIATALSLEQVTDGTMADVSGNWAAGYINALVKAGYMTGSGDGTFKPDTSIQRAESVSVINKSQGFKVTDEIRALIKDMESPFSDVSASDWSFADVLFAAGLIIPAK